MSADRALDRALPVFASRIPRVALGVWPTPVSAVALPASAGGGQVWVKDEGVSNPTYGGNKVRTLEVWLGHARDRGARRIWAIGAYGSNHTIATIVHAGAAGLEVGAIVFPQPTSEWAIENCGAIIASGCPIVRLRSVVEVPFASLAIGRRPGEIVMPPGGATTFGAFGAMGAAFELAEQVAAHALPPPRRLVVAAGSTCTTAGLLAGFALAHAAGTWRWPAPIVHSVRVTPWPVTSRLRIAEYAARVIAHAARLGAPRISITVRELYGRLAVDGRELGAGYGRVTDRARDALEAWTGPRLDGVYSAKAAAALFRLHRAGEGPLLMWASKSAALLEPPTLAELRAAPFALRRWLREA